MTEQKWPSEYVINTSSNWVEQVPRPSEADTHPAVLERRQAAWDAANARNQTILKRSAEIQAEREATEKAARDAAAAQADARAAAKRADLEEPLRRTFLSNGGSEAEWEREKDAIMAERRKSRTLRGEDAARADQRQHLRGVF